MVALIISVASVQAQKSQVIAHRGYWKTAGSAQNSITALQKADSIHCYGSEFDVWLTKDNKLVINHDPVYKMKYLPITSRTYFPNWEKKKLKNAALRN